MGQRANLVIIENGMYELYYDHWCANSLDSYLFWGPEETVSFIRKHDPEKAYWLNDVWCEGGALVDLDRKKLLFFAGGEIKWDVLQRSVYIELLSKMWKNYEVEWADYGVIDLAGYVGYDWKELLNDSIRDEGANVESSFDNEDDHYIRGVLSIYDKDNGMKVFPLYSEENELIFRDGMEVIEYVSNKESKEKVFEEKSYEDYQIPVFGMHIDTEKKEMFFWEPNTMHPDDNYKIVKSWSGWKVLCFYDDYQKHAELLNNISIFPVIDYRKCVSEIERIVCSENEDPADMVNVVFQSIKETGGEDMEVNPEIYNASSFDMPKNSRESIFKKIAEEYLEKISKK